MEDDVYKGHGDKDQVSRGNVGRRENFSVCVHVVIVLLPPEVSSSRVSVLNLRFRGIVLICLHCYEPRVLKLFVSEIYALHHILAVKVNLASS
jgi:hypothetical protein